VPVRVLCVNSGSSSLKVALYEDETPIALGAVQGIGLGEGRLTVYDAAARVLREERGGSSHLPTPRHGHLRRVPAPK
jgi:acetate kinase